MKRLTIYFAVLISLFFSACGGSTETKKTVNEPKPPLPVVSSPTANQQSVTSVNTKKVDADDKLANQRPSNSKSQNSKRTDADDIKKKSDADDKNRLKSNDNDDDDN